MGQEAQARLCWGIKYTNEELGERAETLSDDSWALLVNTQNELYPSPDHNNYYSPEWQECSAKRDAWKKTQPDLEYRGWVDSSEADPFVYMTPSYKSVSWTDCIDIDADTLTVDPSWEATLREYCEDLNLPWKQPGWFISAYYG